MASSTHAEFHISGVDKHGQLFTDSMWFPDIDTTLLGIEYTLPDDLFILNLVTVVVGDIDQTYDYNRAYTEYLTPFEQFISSMGRDFTDMKIPQHCFRRAGSIIKLK